MINGWLGKDTITAEAKRGETPDKVLLLNERHEQASDHGTSILAVSARGHAKFKSRAVPGKSRSHSTGANATSKSLSQEMHLLLPRPLFFLVPKLPKASRPFD